MAERNFKVGEPIEIVYQAPNAATGETITAEIYDEVGVEDAQSPVSLTERGATGTYVGSFTPDVAGEWQAIIHDAGGDGQVTKRYSVGSHNVHSVGEAIADVDADIVAVNADMAKDVTVAKETTVAALPDAAAVKTQADQALADYNVSTKADEDAAHAVTDGLITNLDTKVSALDTPPMVS